MMPCPGFGWRNGKGVGSNFRHGARRCGMARGASSSNQDGRMPGFRKPARSTAQAVVQLYPGRPRTSPASLKSRSRFEWHRRVCCGAATATFSDVTLDMTGIPASPARLRRLPHHSRRRRPRTYDEVARCLCAPRCGLFRLAQADQAQPLHVIVPCHRVLEAGHYADKISPKAAPSPSAGCCRSEGTKTNYQQDPCSMCCCRVAPPRAP